MNYHQILLIVHILSATIWIGGHLILVLTVLPKALKEKHHSRILDFEKSFEPLGLSSLLFLVASGIAMALNYSLYPNTWFHFNSPIERVVSLKLILLLTTVLFALSAKFVVIPRLRSGNGSLNLMAFHIVSVTIIGMLMLMFGTFIRFGGL